MSQAALPGLGEPARRGPARWYRHTPWGVTNGEGRGPFRVLGCPHRWWASHDAEGMRRFLAVEHELGERVAAAFRTPTIEISGVYYLQRRAA